ncbi:MAG: 16S rRNA (guanine(527)-N(7))-methyltransferase RsmG [Sphingomonadales bacterium]|nr:MAG: 16S rRNA (guanine(527)-N(7))-methyltransferase RsmG [Sphingomonadales bacterium]
MSADDALLAELDVSRETLSRLEHFAEILKKWNPRINLVSRASLEQLWTRHIIDSVQVFRCVKPNGHWVDLGSGGGFPGVIVGILAAEEAPELTITLIESDQRKSAFLRTAARECGVKLEVLSERIETVEPQDADILSARALADLDTLLGFSERHLKKNGVALFPKGISWGKECEQARLRWNFSAEPITSRTEPDAVILKIEGVSRV